MAKRKPNNATAGDVTSAGIPWSEVPDYVLTKLEWMDGRHGPAREPLPPIEQVRIPVVLFTLPCLHEDRPRGSKAMIDAQGAKLRLSNCRPGAWVMSPFTGWRWAKWPIRTLIILFLFSWTILNYISSRITILLIHYGATGQQSRIPQGYWCCFNVYYSGHNWPFTYTSPDRRLWSDNDNRIPWCSEPQCHHRLSRTSHLPEIAKLVSVASASTSPAIECFKKPSNSITPVENLLFQRYRPLASFRDRRLLQCERLIRSRPLIALGGALRRSWLLTATGALERLRARIPSTPIHRAAEFQLQSP